MPGMPGKKGGASLSQYLAAVTVTQTAADTASEGSVATGLSVNLDTPMVWSIYQIDWLLSAAEQDGAAGADSYLLGQLTTKSNTSELTFVDDDLIDANGFALVAQGTVASMAYLNLRATHYFSTPVMVASSSIYLRVLSAATGLANTMSCRLYYDLVKITEKQFYQALLVQRT